MNGYYPEGGSPFRSQPDGEHERFAELREAVLLDYGVRTAAAYWGDLDHLRWWCAAEGINVLDPGRTAVARYLDELRAAGYSPNTLARRLTAFRRFYRHLVASGELDRSPVEGMHEQRRRPLRRTRPTPKKPTASQRRRLINAARQLGSRYLAVTQLLLDGVSVAQLCRAEIGDLVSSDAAPTLVVMNRGMPVRISLSRETNETIDACLGHRTSGPLLIDSRGSKLDRFDVSRIMRRVEKRAHLRMER